MGVIANAVKDGKLQRALKSVKLTLEVKGDEDFEATLKFTNTKMIVALLQQMALLEAELDLVKKQLAGEL